MELLKIWEMLLRRKFVVISVFCVFFLTVVVGTYLVTPTYKATAKVHIKKSNALYSLLTGVGLSVKQQESSSSSSNYNTEIALAKLRPLLMEVISSLNLKGRDRKVMKPEKLIEWSLINKVLPQPYVSVSQYEDSDILTIDATSPNPSEAAKISNKLAGLVINDNIESIRKDFRVARMFIDNQINNVREEFYKSLSDLKDYMIRQGTVNLSKEVETLISRIDSLRSDYVDNEKNIMGLETSIKETKAKLGEIEVFRKASEEFEKSEQMNTLKTKLNDLLFSLGEKSLFYTKEHPEYKKIEKDIETVRNLIMNEAKVVLSRETYTIDPGYETAYKQYIQDSINRESYIAKKNLIKLYIDRYQDELLKAPLKNIENSKIDLVLSANKDIYKKLLEFRNQAGIAQSMTLSEIRLVEDAAVPEKPKFPKKTLNFILGISLGLFWGLASAFFVEYIDKTIKSPEDIKQIKSLNILGSIPKSKHLEGMDIISKLEPTSYVVEAYRTIRNNIQYTFASKLPNSIVVTSSAESEGKSSVSSNIAIAFGKTGRRVVIVDLNLRRPSQNNFFNVTKAAGVTDVLADGISLEEAIISTAIHNVNLLPSGPVPHDPSALIESQRLKDTIQKLGEMYDLVIIDTPHVMTVNDAIVAGKTADGVLYVIEPGRVTFPMFRHAVDQFDKAGLNIIGIIFNKAALYR